MAQRVDAPEFEPTRQKKITNFCTLSVDFPTLSVVYASMLTCEDVCVGGASMHVYMGSHFFVKGGGDTPCSSPISVEVPVPTQLRVEWVEAAGSSPLIGGTRCLLLHTVSGDAVAWNYLIIYFKQVFMKTSYKHFLLSSSPQISPLILLFRGGQSPTLGSLALPHLGMRRHFITHGKRAQLLVHCEVSRDAVGLRRLLVTRRDTACSLIHLCQSSGC